MSIVQTGEWRIEEGEGRFAGASGLITSNFTVTANEIELRCDSELEGVCQAWTATGAKDDNAKTESTTVVP